ncbi:serine/arginine repetitive matrix protein 1-like [Zonotrichia leucophrys gambelii]|uniref:serine/arginine repetitive matrix protein 1-like n=1 Tax=Zonotrichia leucophrys gambelii TaxID=257770 RepID=UPI00313FE892
MGMRRADTASPPPNRSRRSASGPAQLPHTQLAPPPQLKKKSKRHRSTTKWRLCRTRLRHRPCRSERNGAATTPAGGPRAGREHSTSAPHRSRPASPALGGEAPEAFTNLGCGSRSRPSRRVARCGAADDRLIGRADTSSLGDRRLRVLRNTGAAPRNGGGPASQRRPARPLAEAVATPLPGESRLLQ